MYLLNIIYMITLPDFFMYRWLHIFVSKVLFFFSILLCQSTHCCQFPSLSFLLLLLASTNFEVLYFFFQVDTIPKFVEIVFHFTLSDTIIYYLCPSLGLIKVKTASTSWLFNPLIAVNFLLSHSCYYFLHPRISKSFTFSSRWTPFQNLSR